MGKVSGLIGMLLFIYLMMRVAAEMHFLPKALLILNGVNQEPLRQFQRQRDEPTVTQHQAPEMPVHEQPIDNATTVSEMIDEPEPTETETEIITTQQAEVKSGPDFTPKPEDTTMGGALRFAPNFKRVE